MINLKVLMRQQVIVLRFWSEIDNDYTCGTHISVMRIISMQYYMKTPIQKPPMSKMR